MMNNYYHQPTYVTTQQPQPGYAVVPQPPMQNFQYPQQLGGYSQPLTNFAQSGYTPEQVRQLLVAEIIKYANDDAAFAFLYNTAAGPANNWLSGYLDQLIETAIRTINLKLAQTPGISINTVLPDVINEIIWCSWANIIELQPAIANDPSMYNDNRLEVARSWSALRKQRVAELKAINNVQAGFNQAPPQVTSYMQPTPFMQQQSNAYNPPFMQQQQSPPQVWGSQPAQTVNNAPPASPFVQDYQQPYRSSRQDPFESSQSGSKQFKLYAFQAELNQARENGETLDRFGNNPNQQVYAALEEQSRNPMGSDEVTFNPKFGYGTSNPGDALRGLSQTNSEANKGRDELYQGMWARKQEALSQTAPLQPTQTQGELWYHAKEQAELGTVTTNPHSFDPMRYFNESKPMAQQPVQDNALRAGHPTMIKPGTFVDLNDDKAMTEIFREIQLKDKQLQDRGGLLDDEVKYLTYDELWKHHYAGGKFEYPYPMPIAVNPTQKRMYAILLTDGSVRQVITPIGEEDIVNRDIHFDVLKDKRESFLVKGDPNAGKTFASQFRETNVNGTVFDRFAPAKAVLDKGLSKLTEVDENDDAARSEIITKAFDGYVEQLEKDRYNELSGRSVQEAVIQASKDPSKIVPLTDDECQSIYDMRSQEVDALADVDPEDIIYVSGITDVFTKMILSKVATSDTEIVGSGEMDKAKLVVGSQDNVIAFYEHPHEREEIIEHLKPFMWADAITEENKQDEENYTAFELVKHLRDIKDKVPANIWSYLNRIATDETNNLLKHTVGLDGVRIESFADDWHELYTYIVKQYDLLVTPENNKPDVNPHIRAGFNYLCSALPVRTRVIHDAQEFLAVDKYGVTTCHYAALRL